MMDGDISTMEEDELEQIEDKTRSSYMLEWYLQIT